MDHLVALMNSLGNWINLQQYGIRLLALQGLGESCKNSGSHYGYLIIVIYISLDFLSICNADYDTSIQRL